jgi:hypothetical protein
LSRATLLAHPDLSAHLHSSQTPPHPPWVPCCCNASRMPGSPSPSPRKATHPSSRSTAHMTASCWPCTRP